MFTDFKNSFTGRFKDIYMQWSNPSQLKCLAILPCDLSLICISDWCQFSDIHISDIHISQGSVATCLRCSGIFKNEFVANLPLSYSVKELWKSVIIWGSYGQECTVLFFIDSLCIWKNSPVSVNLSSIKKDTHKRKLVSFFLPHVVHTVRCRLRVTHNTMSLINL